jgi:glyoxylase I family protein
MATKLHHVNLCSNKVPEMDRFYREVLDLAPIPGRNEQRVTNEGYSGEVAFVTDGATEVHLAAKDLSISFRTGQATLKRGISPFARMTSQPSRAASTTAASPSPTTARGR